LTSIYPFAGINEPPKIVDKFLRMASPEGVLCELFQDAQIKYTPKIIHHSWLGLVILSRRKSLKINVNILGHMTNNLRKFHIKITLLLVKNDLIKRVI